MVFFESNLFTIKAYWPFELGIAFKIQPDSSQNPKLNLFSSFYFYIFYLFNSLKMIYIQIALPSADLYHEWISMIW